MSAPEPNPQLLPSLGRLVRGLSALFWGLPTALLVCFYTARAEAMKLFGIIPPMAATGLLIYALWQIGAFQRQERIWRQALDQSRLLAIILFGLSPFLYWWYKVPNQAFFTVMVGLVACTGLALLGSLNLLLKRLGAMLPDEALRTEIRQFTSFNINLLVTTVILAVIYTVLLQIKQLPIFLERFVTVMTLGSFWFVVLLVLLPLAMTMALIWKTKEVILESIFHARGFD